MSKQFCPQGHDTFVVGRRKSGSCKECNRISTRNRMARYRLDPEWRAKDNLKTSRGWRNPIRALDDSNRRIKKRREVKLQRIAELIEELQ